MERIIGLLATIIGLPSSVLSFLEFKDNNPTLGIIYIAIPVIVIGIPWILATFKKSSPILYYLNLYFGRCGYEIEEKRVIVNYSGATLAEYIVEIKYKSRVNHIIGVLQQYLERPYASADVKNVVKLIEVDDSKKHFICNDWVDSGWVYFNVIPETPQYVGDRGHFKYSMDVVNQQKIAAVTIRDIPIKTLIITINRANDGQAIKSVPNQTVTRPANPNRKLIDKCISDTEIAQYKISYPIEGYRYAIEW
jgi:hypothetical protein